MSGGSTTEKTRYLHTDHLGSVVAITDESGVSVEALSYDAWGKRRETNWGDALAAIEGQETSRGFTDHEHLDKLGLIHMNGRVYDPTLGRFLSADPYVQFPESTQGFNRYTYVNNNPLSYTDPSGFFIGKILRGIGKAIRGVVRGVKSVLRKATSNRFIGTALSIAAAYFTGQLYLANFGTSITTYTAFGDAIVSATLGTKVAAGFAGGFAGGYVGSGGDLKAAAVGGLAGAAFGFVGGSEAFRKVGRISPQRILAHGFIGGGKSVALGGKFLPGFASGAGSKAFTSPGDGVIAGAVKSAVIGGVSAELGGGKFANGAQTAAFGYLFNSTGGISFNFTGSLFGPGGTFGVLFVVDDRLNFRIIQTKGLGIHSNPQASFSVHAEGTDAEDVGALEGFEGQFSIAGNLAIVGPPVGVEGGRTLGQGYSGFFGGFTLGPAALPVGFAANIVKSTTMLEVNLPALFGCDSCRRALER